MTIGQPIEIMPGIEFETRELDRRTNEIAKAHGCDRGTFTVCWAEYERGEICRCKEEARAALEVRVRANANQTGGDDE